MRATQARSNMRGPSFRPPEDPATVYARVRRQSLLGLSPEFLRHSPPVTRHGDDDQRFPAAAISSVQILRGAAQQRRRVLEISYREPSKRTCQGSARALQLPVSTGLHVQLLPTSRVQT
jgi:hypothetical protein